MRKYLVGLVVVAMMILGTRTVEAVKGGANPWVGERKMAVINAQKSAAAEEGSGQEFRDVYDPGAVSGTTGAYDGGSTRTDNVATGNPILNGYYIWNGLFYPVGQVAAASQNNNNGDSGGRAYVPPPPPSCDANNWGAWTACSASCGGGTSTRTNACGTLQSQGCNTISCAGPWWQVKDGSVHSASDVFSNIPGVCAGGCTPSLLTGVSGLASYLGTLGVGGGTLSQDGTDWQAKTVYTGTKTGFGYFKRLLEDDPAGIGAWDGGLPAQNGVSLAEGSMATDGAWNIGSTEKFVFLADGDVTVTGNIDVVPGGFLAVIASGNINIAPAVTKIEGVFVSDGVIDTGISNRQLTGEGIFTGWEGINLQRNLDDDSQTPAELFVYRPDLQLNAYRYLLWLGINWREVAP